LSETNTIGYIPEDLVHEMLVRDAERKRHTP